MATRDVHSILGHTSRAVLAPYIYKQPARCQWLPLDEGALLSSHSIVGDGLRSTKNFPRSKKGRRNKAGSSGASISSIRIILSMLPGYGARRAFSLVDLCAQQDRGERTSFPGTKSPSTETC